jgi:hypothetical protein
MINEFDIPDEPALPAIPADTTNLFVQEAALEFFREEELPTILGISEEHYQMLKADPTIRAKIIKTAQDLRSSGEGFKKSAARFAEALLPDVAAVMYDPEAKPAEKLKAAELIAAWGGYAPKTNANVAVQINLASIFADANNRKQTVMSDRDYLNE